MWFFWRENSNLENFLFLDYVLGFLPNISSSEISPWKIHIQLNLTICIYSNRKDTEDDKLALLKFKEQGVQSNTVMQEKNMYWVVVQNHALWVFKRTEYPLLIHHNALMKKWLILFHREANTSLVISAQSIKVWQFQKFGKELTLEVITGNGSTSFKCCFFLTSADITGFQNTGESE